MQEKPAPPAEEHVTQTSLIQVKPKSAEAKAEPEKTLKQALALTEKNIFGRLQNLFISDQAKNNLESIEEVLYTSDWGL